MTDHIDRLALHFSEYGVLCPPLTCFECNEARRKARKVYAEFVQPLTDGVREAIRIAGQPHYGDSDTALEHYSEAIDILRKLV